MRAVRSCSFLISASLTPALVFNVRDSGTTCLDGGGVGGGALLLAAAHGQRFFRVADFLQGCGELRRRREPIAPFWHNQPHAAHALDRLQEVHTSCDRPPAVSRS